MGESTRSTGGLEPAADAMTRTDVLRLLRRHKAGLARRFGVIESVLDSGETPGTIRCDGPQLDEPAIGGVERTRSRREP